MPRQNLIAKSERTCQTCFRKWMTERFVGELKSANAEFLFLNIIATYGRNLYASVCGIFISWCVLAAVGKSEFGLFGMFGGMTVIALAAYTNIMLCGGIHVGRNIWQV